jgi:dCMP deaminase
MKMSDLELNWSDLVFGSKKAIKDLNAIFVPVPREISTARFTQIIKQYLPIGNIVIGISDEEYINGFSGQSQFKTLQLKSVKSIVNKVNNSSSPNKIMILHCHQSDILPILNKIKFRKVLLVNGSWQYSFHVRPEYYALATQNIPFEFISPFASEDEAIKYSVDFESKVAPLKTDNLLTELEMLQEASAAAKYSFDNGFQTGVSLGMKDGDKYKLAAVSYNKTVPYRTFAWHYGASRERHLSPSGDLNHYDTIHAEMKLLLDAQKSGLKITDMTLFINLLPCPICARMLCESDIKEIVYSLDHSNGYAVALLEKAGKVVRRVIDSDNLIKMEE